MIIIPSISIAADTNTTVSSTVTSSNNTVSSNTIDRTPPTASAPNIVINNQDICVTAVSAAAQTSIVGLSIGTTFRDKNCERLKLARSLYGMGMKVASVSLLCQDKRVFEAMNMAGTPCPIDGKIGEEAKQLWEKRFAKVTQPTHYITKDDDDEEADLWADEGY
jgi:hypothetical protein